MDPSNQPATATALMGASVVWCLLVGVVVVVSSRRLLCSVCCAEKIRRSERVCGEWIRFPAILILFLKSREILAKFPGKWKMGTHSHERWTDDVICGVRDVFGAKFAITPKKQKEALLLHRTKSKSTPARNTKRLIHAPPSTNLNKPASLTPPHQHSPP
jgi:hypothetical protein